MQRPEHLNRFDILYDNPVQIIHNQERFNLPLMKCAVFGIDTLDNKKVFIDLHDKLNYADEPFGFSNRLISEKASWIFSEMFNSQAEAHILDAFDSRNSTNTSLISNETLINDARKGKADWFHYYLSQTDKTGQKILAKILGDDASFGNLINSFPILAFYNNQYFKRKSIDRSFFAFCIGFIGEKTIPKIVNTKPLDYYFYSKIGNDMDSNNLSILTITKSSIQKVTMDEDEWSYHQNIQRAEYRFNQDCEFLNQSIDYTLYSFKNSLNWYFKNLIDGFSLKISNDQFIATTPHFYSIDRTEKSLQIRPKRRYRLESIYEEAREYARRKDGELNYADFIFFLIKKDNLIDIMEFKRGKDNNVNLLKNSLKLRKSTSLLVNEESDIQKILDGQIDMQDFLKNQIDSMIRNGYDLTENI